MKIVTQDWTHECGDGCCTTWGTDLWVNDERVDQTFLDKESAYEYVLRELLGWEVDQLEPDCYEPAKWDEEALSELD